MKPLNIFVALTIFSSSFTVNAEICPAEFMTEHPIVVAVSKEEDERECRKNYAEVTAVLEEQEDSEIERTEFVLSNYAKPDSLAPFHISGGIGGIAGVAAHLHERQLGSAYRKKLLSFYSQLSDEGADAIAAQLKDMTQKDAVYHKALSNLWKGQDKGLEVSALKELESKKDALFKDLYNPDNIREKYMTYYSSLTEARKNKAPRARIERLEKLLKKYEPGRPYARFTLHQELIKLQKIPASSVNPVSSKVKNYALESFEKEFALRSAQKVELEALIKTGEKVASKKFVPRMVKSLGFSTLGMDLVIIGLSSSREAPESLWAQAVEKNPSLLLYPEAMEDSGILQSHEKGSSKQINCLALKRHKEQMKNAAKRLADQQEASFQAKMMVMLFPDKVMQGLEDKPIPTDATSVRQPAVVPGPEKGPKKEEVPEWLKRPF